jgi:oligoendopeptidase F
MKNFKFYLFAFCILSTSISYPQIKEREDIPLKYKWNLSDLFSNENEWIQSKNDISEDLNKIAGYKGKLGNSAKDLYEGLDLYFNMFKRFFKLIDYAQRRSDENLNNSANQQLSQQASVLGTEINEKTSFINPEILQIDPKKIKEFYQTEKKLEQFKVFIEDIQRLRDHTLSSEEEKLLASFGLTTETFSNVYNIFNDAEIPNPKVNLSTNEEVELSSAFFIKYRNSSVRADREKVFEAFFSNYKKFQNTIGSNLTGKVKADFVYAKNRKYSTALEYSLNGSNIPVSVYENLITQIHNSLPTLHRFLELKKKMLGVDTLHYYDLYTPIVKTVDINFTIEQGQNVISEALEPLGKDYISVLQTSFNDRWIDYMPNVGKRSGAYSSGAAYDIHPFILMNWTDDYNSLTTLAHELGHTMHSYYSNKFQPFQTSNYSIFVAEIASTINENLLNRYMVKNARSDEEKLFLLGNYLELLRTTIFRQTLFAEFEWEIHKLIENDQPVTGETLSELYYNLVKKYYGHNEGYCIVDPYIAYEWAFIPHFVNYTYYVYQYATSLIYSTAIAEKINNEGQPAVEDFYKLLKGGNSKYPIELIKDAGINPLSSEPFELTMAKMNEVMDQINEIIK